ncbi:MAG: sulfur oxidation c-type cytochrome SoxX [Burkholderiales bacterium]|nr:sulfur oxidation c-type cytochrome SoxX [Burkholderiales bacterium]
MRRVMVVMALIAAVLAMSMVADSANAADAPVWTGDSIERPVSNVTGDVDRGRAIVASRQTGLCLLCHSLETTGSPNHGNLAPPLAGAGSRLTAGQLRARLVDSRRLDPASIMPAYFVVTPVVGGLAGAEQPPAELSTAATATAAATTSRSNDTAVRHVRVAAIWQGRSLLDAQQIEDVVAYLLTLREPL